RSAVLAALDSVGQSGQSRLAGWKIQGLPGNTRQRCPVARNWMQFDKKFRESLVGEKPIARQGELGVFQGDQPGQQQRNGRELGHGGGSVKFGDECRCLSETTARHSPLVFSGRVQMSEPSPGEGNLLICCECRDFGNAPGAIETCY